MVKERTALSLTYKFLKGGHFTHNKRRHHFIRSYRVNILFIPNSINFPDMIENIRCIISKSIKNVCLTKMTVIHFKCVFKIEILRLFENDFLKSTDTTNRHLNTNHDLQHQIEIFISKKNFFVVFSSFLFTSTDLLFF